MRISEKNRSVHLDAITKEGIRKAFLCPTTALAAEAVVQLTRFNGGWDPFPRSEIDQIAGGVFDPAGLIAGGFIEIDSAGLHHVTAKFVAACHMGSQRVAWDCEVA